MDAREMERLDKIHLVKQLRKNGYSTTEIAKTLGLSESTVRAWTNS